MCALTLLNPCSAGTFSPPQVRERRADSSGASPRWGFLLPVHVWSSLTRAHFAGHLPLLLRGQWSWLSHRAASGSKCKLTSSFSPASTQARLDEGPLFAESSLLLQSTRIPKVYEGDSPHRTFTLFPVRTLLSLRELPEGQFSC